MTRSAGFRRVQATDESHRVTQFELFFDLVFVFAFTQVTALMADDPSVQGATRGLVLMALLWWSWCSYAWLCNQARADRGLLTVTVVIAMTAMFLVALAIPESFADLPGGLSAPLVLAICYAVVRLVHLVTYLVAAGSDTALVRQLLLTALPVLPATGLLITGALLGPPAQTWLWGLALLVDYIGVAATGTSGWQIPSAGHFAERHGLIVIVAIGESLVALGVGVAQQPLSGAVVAGAAMGVLAACCLWWLYFRALAERAEHALMAVSGTDRGRLGRDVYTYLHFPVATSIIFIALGLKKVVEYVADTEAHGPFDALTGVPLVALYAGTAVYVLALAAVQRRAVGTLDRRRIVVGVLLLALIPVGSAVPALAALALVAVVLTALVAVEMVSGPSNDAVART